MASETGPDIRPAVHDYLDRGFRVVPVPYKTKAPVIKNWVGLKVLPGDVDFYFSGPSNVGLLLGAPSNGLVDIDLDSPEAVVAAATVLPPTAMYGGRPAYPQSHYFYRCPEAKNTKFVDKLRVQQGQQQDSMVLEVRSTGNHTVVPPSVHPCGEPYEWVENGPPAEVTQEELMSRVALCAVAALFGRYWPDSGGRHFAALHLSGALLQDGWTKDQAAAVLMAAMNIADDGDVDDRMLCLEGSAAKVEAGEGCSGWLDLRDYVDETVVNCAKRWLRDHKVKVFQQQAYNAVEHKTDLGNAYRILAKHDGEMLFCKGLGWLVWDGRRWKQDEYQVRRWAQEVGKWIIEEEIPSEPDHNKKLALMEHAVDSERSRNISAMVKEAEALCAVAVEDLDQEPWLLNFRNGTYNLLLGEMGQHDPGDKVTKLVDHEYDPTAKCPRWQAFLEQMQPDPEVRAFLRRMAGYFLTGDTMERALFVFYGNGRNGKGTFLNTLNEVLGDYSANVSAATLMRDGRRGGGNSRPDLAKLRGVRFVVVGEANEGDRLDEALVKDLTGGTDKISARFLYKDEMTFRPQAKLVLPTNHLPTVRDTGEAIWDRITPLPWPVRLEVADLDLHLHEKLMAEAPGIVAWAVEGLKEYLEAGFKHPQVIRDLKHEYREGEDLLRLFLTEATVEEEGAVEFVSDLFLAFDWWCRQSGYGRPPFTKHQLNKKLRERGKTSKELTYKGRGGLAWTGLRVKNEARPGVSIDVV